jgi:hypothetical protein
LLDPGAHEFTRLLFNPTFYARQACCARDAALADFRARGFQRMADPHPLFDMRYFVSSQHLTAASTDPFEALEGLAGTAGRCPVTTPFFNPDWYLAANPDVARAGADPFVHYLENGAREGRQANPWYRLRGFGGDPEAFFGALGSLDDWIEEADAARIVTADWIRGFEEISPAGSHSAFWRARAGGAQISPVNLESVFGPTEKAAGENLTLLARVLRRLALAEAPT